MREYDDYFECMLWAEVSPDTELSDKFTHGVSIEDIDPESRTKQELECAEFFAKADFILKNTEYAGNQAQTEHDFFLTRQGHGCGFWEADFCSELEGEALTNIAEQFPTVYCYAEHGVIYIS